VFGYLLYRVIKWGHWPCLKDKIKNEEEPENEEVSERPLSVGFDAGQAIKRKNLFDVNDAGFMTKVLEDNKIYIERLLSIKYFTET